MRFHLTSYNPVTLLILLCTVVFTLSSCRSSRNLRRDPFIMVIDAGHGGRDIGASGRKSNEKDINLKTAKRVSKLIRKHCRHVEVIMTRTDDEYVTLSDRAGMANFFNADLFLSIHSNSARGWAEGTETFIHPSAKGTKSERFARLIQWEYINNGKRESRGVKTGNLAVLRKTRMPAVLTEIGFISNKEEEKFIKSRRGQKKIARCLFNAFKQYYEENR